MVETFISTPGLVRTDAGGYSTFEFLAPKNLMDESYQNLVGFH